MLVDLHGFTTPVARAAIRSALNVLKTEDDYVDKTMRRVSPPRQIRVGRSLVVITGKGRNSKEWLEPVLKPSVQHWLESEFTPSLKAAEQADNPGRLVVCAKNIQEWVRARRE